MKPSNIKKHREYAKKAMAKGRARMAELGFKHMWVHESMQQKVLEVNEKILEKE